jgi:hypothetical protein
MSRPGSNYSLRAFITAAESFGMPVRVLRYVDDKAKLSTVKSGNDEAYRPFFRTLSLSNDSVTSLSALSPRPPSEAEHVQTAYHEATHAYLDVRAKEEAAFQTTMGGWQMLFDGAPLADGSKGDDTDRLVQEAAAEYVGHRASRFWMALEAITYAGLRLEKTKSQERKFWDSLRRIPLAYNTAMSQRSFGYQDRGPFWSSHQVQTTMAIPGPLKDFCDRVILEGRIPDHFARATFAQRYVDLCQSVPGLDCRL